MHTESDIETSARDRKRFSATINGQPMHFGDPTPSVRQMLKAASFVPADECILVQVFPHGTRAVGLDETIDLREPGIEVFWAFKADRVYRFTVDERGFDWGAPSIKEPMLRAIAHVKTEEVRVVVEGAVLHLVAFGIRHAEHL
ncbi:MAG TPA: multiubiquitin domain-containing protein [Opitutaceae bacterium]|jgi:hypothetical protein|nr:multiubiquitin domain-containing protein [Opitutaceae bacterium]